MRYILLIILVVILGIVGFMLYMGQQVSELPEEATRLKPLDIENVSQKSIELEDRVTQELRDSGRTELSSEELETLIYGFLERESNVSAAQIVSGSRIFMRGNRLKIEAVANINKIATDNLPFDAVPLYEVARDFVSSSSLNEVYFSIDGVPHYENGNITFTDEAILRIGSLQYKTDQSSDNRAFIINSDELALLGVSDLYVENGKLILSTK